MKQCPQCSRTYDDSQSFCLMDGTALTVEGEQETVVKPQFSPARKSRLFLWAALTGLVILIGGVSVGGYLIYKLRRTNVDTAENTPTKASVSPTPTNSATPKSAPTEKTTSTDEDAEDVTPIAWNTSAVAFKNDIGSTYKFRCPEIGEEHSIWGSDVYTQDSSICTAAVHAGLFSLEDGGIVTIEFRPGRATYGSTVRNGIKSNPYGEYERSFVVR